MSWKTRLLRPPSLEDWALALQAWRLWIVAGLLGALVGAGLYHFHPPPYRARAEVTVDFNLEEAWPGAGDKELFEYLARESKKLRALAWSDAVLQQAAATAGVPFDPAWRQGRFVLRDEHDGRWHFWVTSPDPEQARRLARAWAQAFTTEVRQRVTVALDLIAKRAALAEVGRQQAQWQAQCSAPAPPQECAETLAALEQQQAALEAEIADLEKASAGILPYVEVSLSQAQGLPVERRSPAAAYAFTGALAGIVLALGWALWAGGSHEG